MRALALGGLRRALDGEHLFVERDRCGVWSDPQVITECLAEPLESANGLPALPRVEMRAHELARRVLVGGVFLGQSIPHGSGAEHVEGATVQAAPRLERPGLVPIVRPECAGG